jgi:thiol-disulfide isomerase/thioredoxin
MSLLVALLLFAAPERLIPVDESAYTKLIQANKGKVVLVDFWATWCAPCRAEMPRVAKMAESLKAKGLVVLTISADDLEQEADAIKFLKQSGLSAPSYVKRPKNDEKFISGVDPKWSGALPAMFLYDKNGKRVKSWIGETPIIELQNGICKSGLMGC